VLSGAVEVLARSTSSFGGALARRSIRPRIAWLADPWPHADVLDVAMLARTGDRRATQVFDDAFAALGLALAPWLARFEATVLVVGGSMAGS
jgi:glucokinase